MTGNNGAPRRVNKIDDYGASIVVGLIFGGPILVWYSVWAGLALDMWRWVTG